MHLAIDPTKKSRDTLCDSNNAIFGRPSLLENMAEGRLASFPSNPCTEEPNEIVDELTVAMHKKLNKANKKKSEVKFK